MQRGVATFNRSFQMHPRRIILTVLSVLVTFSIIKSEVHLSGDIGKVKFDSSNNPYIVDSDILIGSGDSVTIEKGCVLLFSTYTGLDIYGSLLTQGDSASPVVFTSLTDGTYNPSSGQLPNPFDWNGILIRESARKIVLRNFKLMFSVYGIKSLKTDIIIDNGIFRQDGQAHASINGALLQVADNLPFSYGMSVEAPIATGKRVAGDVTLVIRTEPTGAKITIDGKPATAETPLTLDSLAAGQYSLRASKGQLSAADEIVLKPGEIKQVFLKLVKAGTELKVISSPLDAEIYLNRNPGRHSFANGQTPAVFKKVSSGKTQVTLFMPGYRDTTTTIDIIPYQSNNCFIEMAKADARETMYQNQMLVERKKAQFSYYIGGSALLCGAGASILSWLAHSDYAKSNEAKDFLESTVAISGPAYQEKINENRDFARSGDAKRNYSYVLWSLTGLALGVSAVLYF
jgi:hypothetical protein